MTFCDSALSAAGDTINSDKEPWEPKETKLDLGIQLGPAPCQPAPTSAGLCLTSPLLPRRSPQLQML